MEVDEITRTFHEASKYRNDHLRKAIGCFQGNTLTDDALEKAKKHQVNDVKPDDPRYVWTEYTSGKFGWRLRKPVLSVPLTAIKGNITKPMRTKYPLSVYASPVLEAIRNCALNVINNPVVYTDVQLSNAQGWFDSVDKELEERRRQKEAKKEARRARRKADAIRRSTTYYDGGVPGTAKHEGEFGKKLAQTGEHNEKD